MDRLDGQREMEREISSLDGRRQTLLLHACCGPCSSAVLERLLSAFDVTVFYYNPNIEPEEEYAKRLDTLKTLLTHEQAPLLTGAYDPERFHAAARGYEDAPEGGARCEKCFELRLSETAKTAAERGFEYFTTTLSISPHKNARMLNDIGARLAKEYGVRYLYADFKKKDGYKRSIELSKQFDLYRQSDCGCVYSRKSEHFLKKDW